MRPVSIELSAFGPFAGSQRIDFGDLAGNRLFLITGPTGSGKTTLLDAMCFALYGDTSGAERDGKQMRSDHAGPEVLTEVVLDFSLGERLYRVRRVPEQERAKLRGEGTTTQKSDATLWDRTGAGEDTEGVVLGTGWTGVTREVEVLVGFSTEQFRQVIMLPQGKFRELLTASSEQREAILQKLFQTDLYLAVQKALKDRSAAIRRHSETLTERRNTLLEQLGVSDEQALQERLAELARRVGEIEASLVPLRLAETQAVAALHKGKELDAKYTVLKGAEKAVNDLKLTEGEFQEKRSQLARAEKAASLDDLYQQLKMARTGEAKAKDRLETATTAAKAAAADLDKAQKALLQEQGREPERTALQRSIGDLQRHREDAKEIAAARGQANDAEVLFQDAKQALAAMERTLDDNKKAEGELAPRLADATDKATRIDGLKQAADAAAKRLEQYQGLEQARAELSDLGKSHAAALEQRQVREGAVTAARERLRALQQARTDGQAAVLAAALVEGDPCPVCGATHHPRPAEAQGTVPTSEDVEAAQANVDGAQIERDRAKDDVQVIATEIAVAEQRRGSLTLELGEAANAAKDTLTQAAEQARQALISAQTAEKGLADLQAEALQLKTQMGEQEAKLATSRDQIGTLQSDLAAKTAALREREAKVPEQWRETTAVKEALAEATTQLENAQQALRDAENRQQEALKCQSGTAAGLEEAKRGVGESAKILKTLTATWTVRVAEVGFPTEAEYLDARLEPALRERLRGDIAAYDADLTKAAERLNVAREDIKDTRPPDLAALSQHEEEARTAHAAAEKDKTTLETTLAGEKKTEAALADTSRQLDKARNEYAVVGRLSDVANGQNSYRLSFQRFVLTALLDDVLVAASNRLQRMSKGRYRLERITTQGDQRSQGGLDLQVEDAYTGKVRPVASLSGGESFLAALSLALGLAEVVEAYAGGVRLDTIFIDEGFGSLDPEALDLAVNTLVDLQSQGRLVGVISHVPELKERIDVRLELTSTRGSSSAAFSLP